MTASVTATNLKPETLNPSKAGLRFAQPET